MARYQVHTNYICSVYIADGFADDCDELIHRCSKINTLTYEKFCDVWQEMDFACVFHGRPLCSEIAELSEEVLQIAKHYMVANTDNYEESVAGLFLVYGLLNLQPISKFAYLRLIPEDVVAIERLQTVARRNRRLDVLYILGSVLITGSHYHAVQRERGMEYPIRKYLEGYSSMDKQGIRPKGVFYRQNEELDIMRDLNRLSTLYKNAKDNIVGPGTSERNLNYVNHNLPIELDASLKNVINGIVDKNRNGSGDATSVVESSSVQAIKEKAMRMPVKGISHLTAANDVKMPKGRKKRKKPLSKRKGKAKGRPRKRRRRNNTDSETTDNDEMVLSDNSGKSEPEPTANMNVCEIEFIDEYAGKDSDTLPMLVNSKGLPILVENDDSNIEKPILIATGNTDNTENVMDEDAEKSEVVTEDGNSEAVAAPESCVMPDYSKADESVMAEVLKKPSTKRLGKKDKRDLKRPFIKTKFQRMGMLSLANFVDNKNKKKK